MKYLETKICFSSEFNLSIKFVALSSAILISLFLFKSSDSSLIPVTINGRLIIIVEIFIDAINQLVEESEKYNYHLLYHGYYFSDNEINEIKSLISFLKNYIIKSPLFNLENQPNNDIFINYQQHLTLKSDRDESLVDDSKIDKDKFSHQHSNQKDETKNDKKSDEMIDVDKVSIGNDDTTICNDSNSVFDIIFQKEELIVSFIKSIEEIVEIIDNILYTPPYPILFGRISINKKKLDTNQIKKPNPLSKNINKSFYNGFGVDI